MIWRWTKRFFLLGISILSAVLLANYTANRSARDLVHNSIKDTPTKKVGLLLGTGKFLRNGHINLFYKYRIDATIALYKAGKIKYILISGDNSRKGYDEPTNMKEDLIAAGIPETVIYLDYAGFRTLDSIVRCKMVFGERDILVISQQFHNERALYIAAANDMTAEGFNAKTVSKRYGAKTYIREYLARTKMFLDLLFGKDPKFLGEEIKIG
jgi:SanA protein|tara:strand:- start:203 stop:838 length:636 start_codon:yes stop_codon:yes gene_type:complete